MFKNGIYGALPFWKSTLLFPERPPYVFPISSNFFLLQYSLGAKSFCITPCRMFNFFIMTSSIEEVIMKKLNIRQGVMQKLFAPKEYWRRKKLDEIGKTYGGLSGKSKVDFQNGNAPYIPFLNIMNNPIIDTTYFD